MKQRSTTKTMLSELLSNQNQQHSKETRKKPLYIKNETTIINRRINEMYAEDMADEHHCRFFLCIATFVHQSANASEKLLPIISMPPLFFFLKRY